MEHPMDVSAARFVGAFAVAFYVVIALVIALILWSVSALWF